MNIADIARLAGVSRAAVSRYFNNGYISEEKKEAIRKVVEETGYRPSVQAQTLRTKKTRMIGVIVPRIASASMGSIVEGILGVLNESGYQMLLAVTQNNPKKELEYLRAFDDKQVDGVILAATVFTPEHKRTLKNMSVPVVIVGQKLTGCCCVYHDDYHAAFDLTSLLIRKGRKNLGFLSAIQQDRAAGAERCRGFQDALREAHIESQGDNVAVCGFSMEAGYEKTRELLERRPGLDGLVCATDTMALGAVKYLREQNVKIPEQILIAGHGDSAMARVADPSLLTVHYSYEKSGKMAVQMLLEILNEGETALREVKLGYYIAGDEGAQ